jgi:copper chaperone CopZ
MARIAEALQTFPYVNRVQINLNAGTIIVHHDEEALEDIKSKLKDLGVILMAAVGVETSSMSLSDAVSDPARHLGLGTRGILNLKLLAQSDSARLPFCNSPGKAFSSGVRLGT